MRRSRLGLNPYSVLGLALLLAVLAFLAWTTGFLGSGQQDYAVRELQLKMRDGATLHTLVLIPNGASGRPIILTRTPFGAAARLKLGSLHVAQAVSPIYQNAAQRGDILVFQDIRGRNGSAGDFALLQPLAQDPATRKVDESTDAFDTIDYLVHNTPESNGRVGVMGFSFDGLTTLAALLHPHPAIHAAVAIDPLVDGWMGDDWFHHGAFRQVMFPFLTFITGANTTTSGDSSDDYTTLLQAGPAAAYAHAIGLDAVPAWQTLIHHPSYDDFWRSQALDRRLAAEPRIIPTLFVGSLWDAEDRYGAAHAFAAATNRPGAAETQHLVLGPWVHRQANGDGTRTGPLVWDQDTAARFRNEILEPFLQAELETNSTTAPIPTVWAFETGDGGAGWRRYTEWPPACRDGCWSPRARLDLHLHANFRLSAAPPDATEQASDAYKSDPATPVPFSPRPIQVASTIGANWPTWMLEDQRAAATRPDVLTYQSAPLDRKFVVSGEPVAELYTSTTGTDADWVIKLLDIYPDNAEPAAMRGYALPVAMDIFRARYRNDPASPQPLTANQVEHYHLTLPVVNHVFGKGHRVGVQIQSTWFPLYDRNPQSFVENIFTAPPAALQPATQRIFHAPGQASVVELPGGGG
jgi:hypothetical protein